MDKRERELQELLLRNPQLRIVGDTSISRNTDNTCNTHHTRNTVIPSDENMRTEAAAMLESKLQAELRRKALAAGYLYYHTHDSRRSDVGFLDTVLIRVQLKTAQLYFVECKKQNEEPTEDQERWIQALKAFCRLAGYFVGMQVVVDVFVWRPMDLLDGTIDRVLCKPEVT